MSVFESKLIRTMRRSLFVFFSSTFLEGIGVIFAQITVIVICVKIIVNDIISLELYICDPICNRCLEELPKRLKVSQTGIKVNF